MLPFDELKAIRERYRAHLLLIMKTSMDSPRFEFEKIYPATNNIDELLNQIDDLKKCLDSFRPLNPDQAANLQEVFDIEYTYDSNRIEGNTLTLRETDLVINKGLTIGGKPLRHHLEAINHKEAIDYIRDLTIKGAEIDAFVLRSIHSLILRAVDTQNAGVYRLVQVYISASRHIPPDPIIVPQLMEEYFKFYETNKTIQHPVLLASEMHERLVTIHPFIDGNGRTGRLVMNMILLKNGFPIANISGEREKRSAYYDALETRNLGGSLDDFHRIILGSVKESFFSYLRAAASGIGDEEERKGGYFFDRIKGAL